MNIGLDLTWRAEGRDTHICGMLLGEIQVHAGSDEANETDLLHLRLEHVFLGVYVAELLMRLFVDWKRAMSDNWVRFVSWHERGKKAALAGLRRKR